MSAPRILHPELPTFDASAGAFDIPEPLDDLLMALEQGSDELSLRDIDHIEAFAVFYHGTRWTLGDSGGTELDMSVLGVLTDGRWFVVEAWNDFTGWGCQDGADVTIGATRADVLENTTKSAKEAMGVSE